MQSDQFAGRHPVTDKPGHRRYYRSHQLVSMSRKNGCIFLLMLILGLGRLQAQSFDFSKELRFAQYLQDKNSTKEAIRVLEQIDTSSLLPAQKDSLFFLLGWAAYSSKQLDQSAQNLLKVSENSPQYSKSRFFAAY